MSLYSLESYPPPPGALCYLSPSQAKFLLKNQNYKIMLLT